MESKASIQQLTKFCPYAEDGDNIDKDRYNVDKEK